MENKQTFRNELDGTSFDLHHEPGLLVVVVLQKQMPLRNGMVVSAISIDRDGT